MTCLPTPPSIAYLERGNQFRLGAEERGHNSFRPDVSLEVSPGRTELKCRAALHIYKDKMEAQYQL
jgi:hypothetical protein